MVSLLFPLVSDAFDEQQVHSAWRSRPCSTQNLRCSHRCFRPHNPAFHLQAATLWPWLPTESLSGVAEANTLACWTISPPSKSFFRFHLLSCVLMCCVCVCVHVYKDTRVSVCVEAWGWRGYLSSTAFYLFYWSGVSQLSPELANRLARLVFWAYLVLAFQHWSYR